MLVLWSVMAERRSVKLRPGHFGEMGSGYMVAPPSAPDALAPPGAPFADFSEAGYEVLRQAHERLKLRLWMITRASGGDQIVLDAYDNDSGFDGLGAGTVLDWDTSLCRLMVAGLGPRIAAHARDVPAYAHALDGHPDVPVRSYMGVPLRGPRGEVFGTLCGYDRDVCPAALVTDGAEDYLVLQARLLSTILGLELGNLEQRRRAERAESAASVDALTGLANRRTWDAVLAAEDVRCRRYGHPASVLILDLNDLKAVNDRGGHAAGDRLLQACAAVLRDQVRGSDLVARLGGDEFGVLAVETDGDGGLSKAAAVVRALSTAGISAAIGLGVRGPRHSLREAAEVADSLMYADKRRHHAQALSR